MVGDDGSPDQRESARAPGRVPGDLVVAVPVAVGGDGSVGAVDAPGARRG